MTWCQYHRFEELLARIPLPFIAAFVQKTHLHKHSTYSKRQILSIWTGLTSTQLQQFGRTIDGEINDLKLHIIAVYLKETFILNFTLILKTF